MKLKRTLLLITCFSCLMLPAAMAQKNKKIVFDPQFRVMEDSMISMGDKIVNSRDELVRRNATFMFIKTLVATLKLPNSFDYPFDSLKYISVLRSDDNKFRMYTWHLRNDDGTYRYYGAIQMNNKDRLELYPLFDNSAMIEKPQDTILNKSNWYGAHYYKIITPKKGKKDKRYVLLGWKGNNLRTTKKVIDVIHFDQDGQPVFGDDIFKLGDETKKRIVFEFTIQASMMLRYLDKPKWIVYDHLAPPSKRDAGLFEFYGPDLSYDGLKYKKGKWVLMEKIDLRNAPSPLDKEFNDPTR